MYPSIRNGFSLCELLPTLSRNEIASFSTRQRVTSVGMNPFFRVGDFNREGQKAKVFHPLLQSPFGFLDDLQCPVLVLSLSLRSKYGSKTDTPYVYPVLVFFRQPLCSPVQDVDGELKHVQ